MTDIMCNEHHDKIGIYKCVACGQYFCPDCVKTIHYSDEVEYHVCLKCGGKCVDFEQEQRSREEDEAFALSFWTELPKVIFYPLRRGERLSILLCGGYFGFLLFDLIGYLRFEQMPTCPCMPIIVFTWSLYVFVYPLLSLSLFVFLSYLMSLVLYTASGNDKPYGLNVVGLLGRILCRRGWLGAGTIAVFLWYPLRYLFAPGEKNPVLLCLIVLGFLVFPVLFVRIALKEDITAFAPAGVLGVFRKTPREYAVTTAGFLITGMAVYGIIMFGLHCPKPWVGAFGQFWLIPVAVYLLMILMHLFGLFGRLIE